MSYTLIIINQQGASAMTKHESKADVRQEIRKLDAKDMTARVLDANTGTLIYEGLIYHVLMMLDWPTS